VCERERERERVIGETQKKTRKRKKCKRKGKWGHLKAVAYSEIKEKNTMSMRAKIPT